MNKVETQGYLEHSGERKTATAVKLVDHPERSSFQVLTRQVSRAAINRELECQLALSGHCSTAFREYCIIGEEEQEGNVGRGVS